VAEWLKLFALLAYAPWFHAVIGGVYNPKSKDSTVHPSHQCRNTSTIKTNYPYKCVAQCVDSGSDGSSGG
jgi:hypothetical protein